MLKKILLSFFILISVNADYRIDPIHSGIGFKVKHLAISKVPGSFTDFSGNFSFDEKDLSKASVNAVIKIASIDTAQSKRDEHLLSADFFESTKFPEMTFKSKSVNGTLENFNIVGDLTIKGITKEVTLKTSFEGNAKDPTGKQRAAFSATTKINRKDFGLTWNKLLETGALVVGEDVEISLEIVGIKE